MNHLFKRSLSMIMAILMVLAMIPANPVHVRAEEASTAYVAQIGEQKFESLGEAVVALQDGETLKILTGFTAEANQFVELNGKKNVTITAAEGAVIEGNISFGYHASHIDGADRTNSTLTIDGLTVNGTLTVCSNDANFVITNNKAAQLTVKTYREGMNITIDGNTADGAMGTATNGYGMFIVPNATDYNLTVSDNTFKNVQSHAFVVQGCGDGAAVTAANSIAVTGNNFASWGLGGKSDRAAFKIWADMKYAPSSSDLNGTTNAMRELVTEIAAGGNTFATASNTVQFDAYDAAGNVEDFPAPAYNVAEVNGVGYESIADALEAAQNGDVIVLLADVTLDRAVTLTNIALTITGDYTLNANDLLTLAGTVSLNAPKLTGDVAAAGNAVIKDTNIGGYLYLNASDSALTFQGDNKVNGFSASYYNNVITIGAGAYLEITGSQRLTIGWGNTFNITGTIEDAKTADKSAIKPSLKVAAGITVNGSSALTTFNVANAYIVLSSTCGTNKNATGKFVISFTNTIADLSMFKQQYAYGTYDVDFIDSVINVGANLVFLSPDAVVDVDNSNITVNSSFGNAGKFTLSNDSAMTVKSMLESTENGYNAGLTIVDDATLNVTGGVYSGYNTGKLQVVNGGVANINKIVKSTIELDADSTVNVTTIDATSSIILGAGASMVAPEGLTVTTAEGWEVKYENGAFVSVQPKVYVAEVGGVKYESLADAIAAWTNGTTLTLLSDVTLSDVITLKSTEHHILNLGTYTLTAASGKDAFVIKACGTGSSERSALTINADATNPGGINAGNKCIVYYKYADGGITTEDRPIIKINGGVFTGSTASWGTAGIYTIGTAARKCATLNIAGGTFNCTINGNTKSKLIISGGTFNYSVGSQGDSTALRLISGGTFKTFGFMTADSNNTKFWFGTSMGNSNVGVHVDDNGYIVVGGSVITEAGEKFEASSTNYSGASSLLQYSSAKNNGLYYTSAKEALADNNKANGSVTIYADELDMTDISYKGTIVADGLTKITNAPDGLKVVDTEGNKLSIDNEGKLFIAVAKIGDTFYASFEAALAAACADSTITEIVILCDSEVTSFDTSDYYNIAGNLKITANEGNNYTITIKPIGTDTIAVKVQGEGASLTIGKGVTINWLDVVANGFYTQGENMVIEGTLYAKSLKQWTSNGSIVVAETGKVVLGNSDGQFDLNYGSGDVTITGTGDKTAPQFKAGYTTTQGYANGYTLNLKDTYFEGGAWFNLNGKNGTINVDNSILKVSGGDGAGSMTIANSGNVINLTNGAELAVANLTIGAGNTIKLGAGSKITTNKITGTGNLVIDAAGMTAGEVAVITGNLSGFTGTLEVVNNDDLEAKIEDGKLVLVKKPVASVTAADGTVTSYATLQDAFKAATEGCTIEILSDVTISEKWDCRDYATGGSHSQFKVSVTINGNGHTIKFTGTVNDNNWNTIFRFEENATVNKLTIDISGATGAQRVISAKKSLTVDGLTIIGSARFGVIFGEGASATDLAATEIVIKNSTLTGTRRAISDNEGGKDVKSVVITDNTLNANVYVSASESIVFNNNKAEGEVDLRSYGADNVLSVEAQGNTLTGAKNYIYAKTIDAQAEFTTKNPPIKVSTKNELDTALAAAKDGDIIVLTADIDYGTTQLAITKTITLDLGGKTLTTGNAYGGISVKNNATIKNGTIVHASNTAAIKVWNATAFEDLVIDVQGKGDANKTIGGIVLQSGSTTRVGSIKNVTIKGAALTNGIETYNCGDATENVIGSMDTVTIDAKGTGMLISAPCGTATNCSISGDVNGIEIFIKGTYSASLELVSSKVEGGVYAHDEFNSNPGVENNGTLSLTVDEATTGASAKDVTLTLARAEKVEGVVEEVKDNAKAKVNDTYHLTLTEALAAWTEGTTLTLLANAEISAPIAITESKTLDGNGKTLTYTGTDRAIDVPNTANGANVTIKNLTVNAVKANRGINYNTTGELTVENVTVSIGANVDGYAINFPSSADGAKVTITNSNLTSRIPVNVWGSGMVINITNTNITSLDDNANYTYSGIQLNNDTYGNVADGTVVTVTGGSITARDEKGNPSLAVSNWSSTGKVNISDTTIVTGNVKNVIAWLGGVGYTDLQAAFNDIAEKGYNSPLILVRDITLDKIVTIPAGIKATLDLNGHTITGIDNATGSFGLFTNRGELTVTGNGTITLEATENRGWNAYSSIFSNTVGGKLTIENGTFEHLGGTDMAYAIDNLTNGKGTYAETVINGGSIKSTYRAIRQFLNGVEAQNILTVNGGTIEGANKSIWMQDPSKNANSGKLTVSKDAIINGHVYLDVTEGSTAWPVEVSVAASAVKGDVISENVPATYVLENVNGTWSVIRGLKGKGTAADPYKIGTVAELELFRNSVNAGETKYNAPGVYVALTDDIDLAGINWVGIGSATAEHGFMGNFDGKTYKIKNLTINNPALDADDYAYAGLFAVTEGAEGAENVIKNLTIENVTINTTGHIVSAAIAYPYYTTVENVTVCGDIKISGGNYTAGALAYTRRCVNASNVTVEGNDGSYITGKITVGGVISDIQMNGGLKANYFNFSVSGVTITGEKSVGGISGIIATQTLNGATVKNVKLVGEKAGIVAGALGGTSTISGVTYQNVTGATAIIGTNYDGSAVVEAKIGDTYYSTLENALAAAQAGQTIELLAPIVVNAGETLTLDKDVKIVYTSNVVGEDMFTVRGTLNVKAGTITYTNTDTTGSNVTVSTISCEPGSVLNVTGGTIENKSVKADGSSSYPYAIDMLTNGNLGDVTVTISGGKVYSDYMAIRQFNNGTACKNTLTVSGGEIYGAKRAIQVHIDNTAAYTTISGGKIAAGENGYALCLFAKNNENLSVTGGEFLGDVYSATNGFITGGTFEKVYEEYCTEGYIPVKNADGKYIVKAGKFVAQVNDTKYDSLAAAIADAKSGDTIVLLDNITEDVTINNKSLTIDGNGKTYTGNIAVKDNNNIEVTIKNVNFVNGSGYAVTTNTIRSITIEDCTVTGYGSGLLYANKSTGTIVVKDVTIDGGNYGMHWAYGTKATLENVTMTNVQRGIMIQNNGSKTITLKNCSIDAEEAIFVWEKGTAVDTFIFEGVNTISKMPTSQYAKVVGATIEGTNYYGDLQSMIEKAENGQTVKLLSDIDLSKTELQTLAGQYDTYFLVEGKDITVDLNGKIISGEYTGNMLVGVFSTDNNGKLTLTGNGTVDVTATGKVYTLITAFNDGSSVIIENGTYKLDKASDSLIYYGGNTDAELIVNGGTFELGNVGTGENGKPWIFNTYGAGDHHILITGGTFNADINNQHWSNEAIVDKTCYVVKNNNGTWTVKEGAVAYVQTGMITGPYYAPKDIGYATIEEAIAAAVAYNDVNITLLKDVQLTRDVEISIAGVVLNTNGHSFDCNGNKIILTAADATLAAPAGLNVVAADDTYFVNYSNGAYSLDLCAARNVDTGKYYATVNEALLAAQSGETVIVLVDGKKTENLLMVGAGVTLNLNGHTVAAGNVFSFGDIIDNDGTTDGKGGIIISNDRTKAFVQLQKGNDYLPLYDAADGCYRFFSYNLSVLKYEITGTNTIKFKYRLRLATAEAYQLLADSANAGVEFVVNLTVTDADGKSTSVRYVLSGDNLRAYANAAYDQVANGEKEAMKVSKYIGFNLSGIGAMEAGSVIVANAEITTETGMSFEKVAPSESANGHTQYTVPEK